MIYAVVTRSGLLVELSNKLPTAVADERIFKVDKDALNLVEVGDVNAWQTILERLNIEGVE